jgi:hypothetical protein
MMSAEKCLAKAKECERLATETSDPHTRAIYADLALQWRILAERVGHFDRVSDAIERERLKCIAWFA